MTAEKSGAPTPPARKGPNCWDCRFLTITWDVRTPYGCKLMGFRSRVLPSLEVLRTDGRFCGGFSPKVDARQNKPKVKPTQAVGNPSNRRDSDRRRPIISINLIT